MEHGQKNQIEEVNTYEENEIVEKNCLDCEFLRFNPKCKMFCFRRENEGVICEIDKGKVCLPCHARDTEVWDEEIDEDGEFKANNELGYGYQLWLKKREERKLDIDMDMGD
jgi:hypothetical protein